MKPPLIEGSDIYLAVKLLEMDSTNGGKKAPLTGADMEIKCRESSIDFGVLMEIRCVKRMSKYVQGIRMRLLCRCKMECCW